MKYVIINGDDFGMNERCSQAIVRAFDEGLVTDTTMMANGAYFEQAAALARKNGFDDRIGIHFNLTEGRPLTREICSFNGFVEDGLFRKDWLSKPCALSEAEQRAVYAELFAQVRRLTDADIRITHADSHHYIHNYTHIAPLVVSVCRRCGISKIRLNRTFDTPQHPRLTDNRVDNRYWREQGFVTTEHFGRPSDLAQGTVPDSTEILVHPDFDMSGELIDRLTMSGGYPCGVKLEMALRRISNSFLISYRNLRNE